MSMRLSCNFVNVYTIAYRVQYTFTRVHARIPKGHPREDPGEEKRACRTSRQTSRRGCPCRCRSRGILAIRWSVVSVTVCLCALRGDAPGCRRTHTGCSGGGRHLGHVTIFTSGPVSALIYYLQLTKALPAWVCKSIGLFRFSRWMEVVHGN